MAEKRPDIAVLKRVRLSFPKLWEKEAINSTAKERYSCNLLFKEGDPYFAENKAAISSAIKYAREKLWADKGAKIWESLEKNRKCFRKGDQFTNEEGDVYAGYEGSLVVATGNQNEFQRLDRDKRPLPQKSPKLYGGAWVDAVVSVYAVTGNERGGNGVFCTLEVIRFVEDGESFGNAPVDVDDYLDDLDSSSSGGGDSGGDDDDMI